MTATASPTGTCPTCGRRQGWDGHAYAPCTPVFRAVYRAADATGTWAGRYDPATGRGVLTGGTGPVSGYDAWKDQLLAAHPDAVITAHPYLTTH